MRALGLIQVTEAQDAYFSKLARLPCDIYETFLKDCEPQLLRAVMQRTRHNRSTAARLLGIGPANLRKKLRRYGMEST